MPRDVDDLRGLTGRPKASHDERAFLDAIQDRGAVKRGYRALDKVELVDSLEIHAFLDAKEVFIF